MTRALIVATALLAVSSARADSEVAPGVTLVPGAFVPGAQPDGNSVVLDAPAGLIVVDTGRHPEHTAAILEVARLKKKPIVAIVNTHWHLDHVGGNPIVRRAYPKVRVYASNAIEEARKGFLDDYRKQLEQAIAGEPDAAKQAPYRAELALIAAGAALGPDEKVTASGTRAIAGKKLEVHLETHVVTAGDVWLLDPATGTLIAGDLVTIPVPFLDTACPARWLEALDRMTKVDFKVLVPGHGAPMSKAELVTYRNAFGNFVACAASSKDKTACVDGWQTDAASLLGGADAKFTRAVADYYVENTLRGDAKHSVRLCGQS